MAPAQPSVSPLMMMMAAPCSTSGKGLADIFSLDLGDVSGAISMVEAALATTTAVASVAPQLLRAPFVAQAQAAAIGAGAFTGGFGGGSAYVHHKVSKYEGLADLKSLWSPFFPSTLLRVLVKNVGVQLLMRFNQYMLDVLDHEKQLLEAEEQDRQPPEMPPLPDFKPAVVHGLHLFARETTVTTVRRIYEHIAVARVPRGKAAALLRDSKAWIRDVLAPQCQGLPLLRRAVKYQFATLHASVLFYAAECTVAIAQHAYRALRRGDRTKEQKALLLARIAALQAFRCSVTLAAVSVGAAVGSLIKPGPGTTLFTMGTDIAVSISLLHLINPLME